MCAHEGTAGKAARIAYINLAGLQTVPGRKTAQAFAEYGKIAFVLASEQAKLCLRVFGHIFVIIQMIGSNVK